jgi:hypothetical protein
MRGDIRQFCLACPACQEAKADGPRAILKPLEMAIRPNMVLGSDIYDPIRPKSYNNTSHVLLLVDHFSKFIKLRAIPDTSAETVATAILNDHIYVHGMFKVLVSDRGGCYISKVMKELFRLLGSKQSRTSGYSP